MLYKIGSQCQCAFNRKKPEAIKLFVPQFSQIKETRRKHILTGVMFSNLTDGSVHDLKCLGCPADDLVVDWCYTNILRIFFSTSQTVCLFLPRLTDGTTRIYFHRQRNLYENSYHLCCGMPQPGFKLTSVELAPLCGTLIQARFTN